MKLAALCCTYLRPAALGELIECFLRQDYPVDQRQLVILDDAGQYQSQSRDGWRLISIPHRFRTLGEKRNACAALADRDVEGFLIADDDDLYLPHWFRSQAEALRRADWSRPEGVLVERDGGFEEIPTGGLYHGGWAYRRALFDRVRGYAAVNNGEDQEIAGRFQAAGATAADPCGWAAPFYIYRVQNGSYHLSYMDDQGYADLGAGRPRDRVSLRIGWSRDYRSLPIRRYLCFAPHVAPAASGQRVELIGAVHDAGRNGPTNGMYALQKALRRRIEEGLDWLSIRALPASEGALPWFWNWHDRRYAN